MNPFNIYHHGRIVEARTNNRPINKTWGTESEALAYGLAQGFDRFCIYRENSSGALVRHAEFTVTDKGAPVTPGTLAWQDILRLQGCTVESRTIIAPNGNKEFLARTIEELPLTIWAPHHSTAKRLLKSAGLTVVKVEREAWPAPLED